MTTVALAPPPETAKLILLDSYGLIYRSFHALPELTTTKGMRIEAAYGFTTTLAKIVADERPTHLIACFDRGLPQARVARYEAYKAQRDVMPDDLRSQFALVRRILGVYGIPIVEVEGEEADDVIATLARQAAEARQRTEVVTGDNDLLQIVDERTTVLRTRRGISDFDRFDPAAVRARFELQPSQLADYRGLKGDPSDNLPGIPGVGEKTAIKLIKAAGSLDALLANPALAGSAKLETLVREYGEIARACRDVSVIASDLPIVLSWEDARYIEPPTDQLYVLFRDLEFKTLLSRLPAPQNDIAPAADVDEPVSGAYVSFVASTDPPDFVQLAHRLKQAAQAERVALALHGDTEIGVSTAAGHAIAFRVPALGHAAVGDAFAALLGRRAPLAGHDTKRLLAALRPYGEPAFTDDTMVAAHLLEPSRTFASLADAASRFLVRSLPAEPCAHADATYQLALVMRDHLQHREQSALYENIEVPVAAILARMEAAGVAIDPRALVELAGEVDASIARLQRGIWDFAGEEFNIGSPQQLGTILFEKLEIPSGGRTKTGWATGAEVLQVLARSYPICAKVLEYREVTKLKNTYIDVIPKLMGVDGRLRTIFNQTATATGRLSSTNPNLQNIPVRTELGRRIRRAFVAPDPLRALVAADYNQIELRIMAHISGDAAMREAFLCGEDIHDVTARGIFHVADDEQPSPNQRRIAKSVNFGLLYGMSDFGLAQRLEIERKEAKAMTEAYFARFPSVRTYIAQTLERGRELGYVETMMGRRRYMPDLRSRNFALRAAAEREATNAPLQGSAADLMKLAMVRVDGALRAAELDAVMVLQIHDELVFEIDRAQREPIVTIVKDEMERVVALSVPLAVTVKAGSSLYGMGSFDDLEWAADDAVASNG